MVEYNMVYYNTAGFYLVVYTLSHSQTTAATMQHIYPAVSLRGVGRVLSLGFRDYGLLFRGCGLGFRVLIAFG